MSITRLYHYLRNPPSGYSATRLLILSFLTLKQLPTYSSIKPRTLYTNHKWSYQARKAQDVPTRVNRSMKIPSYLENQAEAYRCLEEFKIDSKKARVCTPGWSFTIKASVPAKEITMKIKPEVILGQQLAAQADGFLEIIDKSLNPLPGGQMILREQAAAGVCYLCAKHGHISVNCPKLKLGGPQNKAERIGSWYRSNVNMQTYPSCTRSGTGRSLS